MKQNVDLVKVSYHDKKVGRLAISTDNTALFEYDVDWLSHGFSISPIVLPLSQKTFKAKAEPFNGLFGVFNDSLPDGWGQLLIDRYMRQQGVNPQNITLLDRLSLVGKYGMGALSYSPSDDKKSHSEQADLSFYASEVHAILHEDKADNLDLLIAKNGSSAGVRPKVIIRHEQADWMVKFPAMYDSDDIGSIEYETSLLAKKCKIEMSETKLFQGKYFGTKLFDRDATQRYHVHTASGLLYASHRYPSMDYEDLLKLTHMLTKDMREIEKMFNLMVFNVFIGNKDDHAKNFAFIFKENQWKLAPAYDLTPSSGFNGNHSTSILGKGNPDENDMIQLAKKIGFPVKKAKHIIDRNKAVIGEKQ